MELLHAIRKFVALRVYSKRMIAKAKAKRFFDVGREFVDDANFNYLL